MSYFVILHILTSMFGSRGTKEVKMKKSVYEMTHEQEKKLIIFLILDFFSISTLIFYSIRIKLNIQ